MNSRRVSTSILRWLGLCIGVLVATLMMGDQTALAVPPVIMPATGDFYIYQPNQPGLISTWHQMVFGPTQVVSFGDAYSPTTSPYYSELNGAYTYRVAVPSDYAYDDVRVEIFDPDTGNNPGTSIRTYGVDGTMNAPANCGDRKDACLFNTPWGGAPGTNPNPRWFVHVDENRSPNASGPAYTSNLANNTRTLYRLYYLQVMPDGSLEEVDLAYYIGKGDGASVASPTGQYNATQAQNEALSTDLKWVSPGAPTPERMPAFDSAPGDLSCVFEQINASFPATFPSPPSPPLCSTAEPPTIVENCATYRAMFYGTPASGGHTQASQCEGNGDFIVDLSTEIPGLLADPYTGERSIFIQVRTLSGASENGYSFWAGPPRTADPEDFDFTVPADVNARQVYVLANEGLAPQYMRETGGVEVFAQNYMPADSVASGTPISMPVTYIPTELAGETVSLELFDADSGAEDPIIFYFEGIPQSQWAVCFDDNGDSTSWSTCAAQGLTRDPSIPANIPFSSLFTSPPYTLTIPLTINGNPFAGGRLLVQYQHGVHDAFVLRMLCCDIELTAPHSLQATVNGTDVNLTWVDASDNETYFVIERSYDGITWTQIGMATTPAFTDTTAILGDSPQYRVRAFHMDNNAFSDPSNVVIVDVAAPVITSAASVTFYELFSGSFTFTATGDPAPTIALSGALPTGVTFDPMTGILSGTPAAGAAGIYPLTVTAANGVSPDATQNFTLTVDKAAFTAEPVGSGSCAKLSSIVNMKLRGMVAGRSYTYTFEVRDATTVYMIRQINSTFAGPTGTQIHFKWVIFPFDNVPALDAPQTYSSAWTSLPTTVTLKVTAVDRTTNLMSQTTFSYTCGTGAVSTSAPVFTPDVTGAPYAP